MEIRLDNGEYVLDDLGATRRVTGDEEVLQRVTMRLQARRGTFSPDRTYGSRLWTLGRLPKSQRPGAARQFAAEALSDEKDVELLNVSYVETGDEDALITVTLGVGGRETEISINI